MSPMLFYYWVHFILFLNFEVLYTYVMVFNLALAILISVQLKYEIYFNALLVIQIICFK